MENETTLEFIQLLGAIYGAGRKDDRSVSCDLSVESRLLETARRVAERWEPLSPTTVRFYFTGRAAEWVRFLGEDLRSPLWDEAGRLAGAQGEPAQERAFFRGFFEVCGGLETRAGQPTLRLVCRDSAVSSRIAELLGPTTPREKNPRRAEGPEECVWSGVNAIDACGRLWEEARWTMPATQRQIYDSWLSCLIPAQTASRGTVPEMRVQRLRADAVLPFKARVSDSGYDLCLLDVHKRIGKVVLYTTGLSVAPPPGYYFDIVPRSSIIKLGYLLANSVGVIDRAYRGELLVPLIKIDDATPDIELPARVVQLIPRAISHFPVVEVEALDASDRGGQGFGSSGHR